VDTVYKVNEKNSLIGVFRTKRRRSRPVLKIMQIALVV